ncbi:MAG: 5-bromo-4-chloroindolyl phosphate hydrolysis family protein, partial [Lachnospiraceae bacterium]|nr:5-bromo-4-chloroindolyl phosphate hydrolysis family protein [Lachnospiraceae bacterium]
MKETNGIADVIEQVSNVIDDAVHSDDFSELNNRIGNIIQGVARTVSDKVDSWKKRDKGDAAYFAEPLDSTGSKIPAVLGAAGLVIFGLITIVTIAMSLAGVQAATVFAILGGIISACCAAMVYFGTRSAKKTEHFNKYREILRRKKFASIRDISGETGVPEKVVLSELNEFTERKLFKQGHFDDRKTCFIASDELYEEYRRTQKASDEMKAREEERKKAEGEVSPEIRKILDDGNAYIRLIRESNDAIPGEEITGKLNRMEHIVRRIFEEVKKRPELAGSLNLFMNYYLPTTTKLILAYRDLDARDVQGDNITTAKREIENSLDTIS